MKRTRTAAHPPKVVQKIKKLRSTGDTVVNIAKKLKVSTSSVSKFSVPPEPPIVGRPRKAVFSEGFFDDKGLCPITGVKVY